MSADAATLTALQDLGARLKPGALLYGLAPPQEADAVWAQLPKEGLAWVGWRQREALLRAWRPAAQERYHSVAGRDAPTVRDWLSERFKEWRLGADGASRPEVAWDRVDAALALCGLAELAGRPLSLLSNGESARACLAASLGSKPRCLVLDDLTEGLDAAGRATLWACARAVAQRGAAVLLLSSRESLLPWAEKAVHALSLDRRPGAEVFACRDLDLDAGDRPLLKALDWRLRVGEAWWLQGPNGAGKSTLLAYLSGEHPQAWARSWSLQGRPRAAWTPLHVLRREVAWVSPELAAVANRPLEDLLNEALDRPAPLLLLDEALRGLGPSALARCEERLARAFAQGDRCLVFVSHDPQELPPVINRSLVLDGGGGWSQE